MLKSLERYHIIQHGYGMSSESRKTPEGAMLYTRYIEETEKYRLYEERREKLRERVDDNDGS